MLLEARKIRQVLAIEASLEIQKTFCAIQNYIKLIDKSIFYMELDEDFLKKKEQNNMYF